MLVNKISKEKALFSLFSVLLDLPNLDKRILVWGKCAGCGEPFITILLDNLDLTFCINCGWASIEDELRKSEIIRSTNSLKRLK